VCVRVCSDQVVGGEQLAAVGDRSRGEQEQQQPIEGMDHRGDKAAAATVGVGAR
jgi:hypothetical protein